MLVRPGEEGRRGTTSQLSRLLVTGASVLALAGLGQLAFGWFPGFGSGAGPPQPQAAAADGVAAGVREVQWIAHDHDAPSGTGPGYQMPLSMMPGMVPDGQARLAVSLTVANTADIGRPVDPAAEFVLRDEIGDGKWQPAADTFAGLSRLAPGSAADGVLYFDLPPPTDAGQLYVDWEHAGRSLRLAIRPGQDGSTHSHTS